MPAPIAISRAPRTPGLGRRAVLFLLGLPAYRFCGFLLISYEKRSPMILALGARVSAHLAANARPAGGAYFYTSAARARC